MVLAVVGAVISFKWGVTLNDAVAGVIPLGLSYYGLRILHLVFEWLRGDRPRFDSAEVIRYLLFSPTQIAGPINRYPDFARDGRRRRWDSALFAVGLGERRAAALEVGTQSSVNHRRVEVEAEHADVRPHPLLERRQEVIRPGTAPRAVHQLTRSDRCRRLLVGVNLGDPPNQAGGWRRSQYVGDDVGVEDDHSMILPLQSWSRYSRQGSTVMPSDGAAAEAEIPEGCLPTPVSTNCVLLFSVIQLSRWLSWALA